MYSALCPSAYKMCLLALFYFIIIYMNSLYGVLCHEVLQALSSPHIIYILTTDHIL